MLDFVFAKVVDSAGDTFAKVINDPMVVVGLVGQAVFMSRFLVQWIASERARRSVIPIAFWYLSIIGSTVLLAYALYKEDPVFIIGQLFGFIVYGRNLWLIKNGKTQQKES